VLSELDRQGQGAPQRRTPEMLGDRVMLMVIEAGIRGQPRVDDRRRIRSVRPHPDDHWRIRDARLLDRHARGDRQTRCIGCIEQFVRA
jgi:hypothetical protein